MKCLPKGQTECYNKSMERCTLHAFISKQVKMNWFTIAIISQGETDVEIRTPHYYKEFSCLASNCPDTCCQDWEVVLDDETYQDYQQVSGELGERIRSAVVVSQGDRCFALKGESCPFLTEEKLCEIHRVLGEEYTCAICRSHPRFMEEYGTLREVSLSASCPEVTRLMLRDAALATFPVEWTQEEPVVCDDVDEQLLERLLPCREMAIELLQDRRFPLHRRAAMALAFAHDIQTMLDRDETDRLDEVCAIYKSPELPEAFGEFMEEFSGQDGEREMAGFLAGFCRLDLLKDSWGKRLNNAIEQLHGTAEARRAYGQRCKDFRAYYGQRWYEYEHFLVYFVYRHFLRADFDREVFSRMQSAVLSGLLLRELGMAQWLVQGEFATEDQIDLIHRYSREVEHCADNLDLLAKQCREDERFGLEPILCLLAD